MITNLIKNSSILVNFNNLNALFSKEIATEIRSKAHLGSFILYLFATIYVCFLSFRKIVDFPTWNALFWIIIVFSAINISAKLYNYDARGRKFYIGLLAHPLEIFYAKFLFNFVLLFFTSLIGYIIYSLVLGNLVSNFWQFLIVIFFGTLGFSAILTTVSAISSKANSNFSLMSVLSFPMLIPFLISLIKFSKNVLDGLNFELNYKLIVVMLSIITIQMALSFLLIPYLWRD